MALNGNETLQVLGQDATGAPAATTLQTTTGAIAALASVEGTPITNTSITTVGNGTLTAAGLVGGLISRTGPVANYSDATATAVAIVAALPVLVVNSTFLIRIKNATAFTQTITAGVGVTLPPTVIIPAFSIGNYYGTVTSATAVTLTHLSTVMIADSITLTAPASTALTTVGAGTITAAGIVSGITIRGGSQSGTPFADTTDTADNIIAAQPGIVNKIGTAFLYRYINNTNAVATLSGGTGVTVSVITVVPASMSVLYLITYTAASTLTVVGLAISSYNSGQIVFAGSSSGETILLPTAAASGTLTLPAATDTLVGKATTDTLTNKTLTLPTIGATGEVFNGSTSGTTTLLASAIAGSTVQTLPAVTGVIASTTGTNLFVADLKRCTAQVDSTGTTLANVTGLSFTVVPGTYSFSGAIDTTCGGTGGVKLAFNYTTTVVSVINANGFAYTASAIAVSKTTTTTTQTSIVASNTAFTNVILTGTIVVTTGGTVDLQFAENSANSTSSVLVGSTLQFTRIA